MVWIDSWNISGRFVACLLNSKVQNRAIQQRSILKCSCYLYDRNTSTSWIYFVQALLHDVDNAFPRLAHVVSMSFSMYASVRDSQVCQITLWSTGRAVCYILFIVSNYYSKENLSISNNETCHSCKDDICNFIFRIMRHVVKIYRNMWLATKSNVGKARVYGYLTEV